MTLKLNNFTFVHAPPRTPGIRAGDLTQVDCENPNTPLIGWRIAIRGQMFYMISPPGWNHNTASSPAQRDSKGPVMIVQMPLSNVFLQWSAGDAEDLDAVLKGNKWDSPQPLGWKPPVPVVEDKSLLAQIPASQIGDA